MEWKKVKISDIATLINGRAYAQPELLYEGKYKIVRVGNLSGGDNWFFSNMELGEDKYCNEGDLLYAWACNFGPYIWHGDKTIFHYHIWKMILDESLANKSYLYYYLKYITPYWLGNVNGSVMVHITKGTMEKQEFPLPPLETQRRIAAILSSLDDKIENNNRINRNLEEQAQALFKSWFVDFEPWGGTMPEDWREGTIADLVNLLNGFAFKSSDFVANGIFNLITIKGVQDGKMTTDGADHLDATPARMPNWCLLKKGDILLSLTGNVGRCCLVDIENCLLNQRVAKLQPRAEYNRLFVYTLFRQDEMKSRMISISRGTAQMNLSPIETGKLSIIVPTDKVLENFGMRYNGILDIILNNISESQRLAALRDTLLPKLMKGEIEV